MENFCGAPSLKRTPEPETPKLYAQNPIKDLFKEPFEGSMTVCSNPLKVLVSNVLGDLRSRLRRLRASVFSLL